MWDGFYDYHLSYVEEEIDEEEDPCKIAPGKMAVQYRPGGWEEVSFPPLDLSDEYEVAGEKVLFIAGVIPGNLLSPVASRAGVTFSAPAELRSGFPAAAWDDLEDTRWLYLKVDPRAFGTLALLPAAYDYTAYLVLGHQPYAVYTLQTVTMPNGCPGLLVRLWVGAICHLTYWSMAWADNRACDGTPNEIVQLRGLGLRTANCLTACGVRVDADIYRPHGVLLSLNKDFARTPDEGWVTSPYFEDWSGSVIACLPVDSGPTELLRGPGRGVLSGFGGWVEDTDHATAGVMLQAQVFINMEGMTATEVMATTTGAPKHAFRKVFGAGVRLRHKVAYVPAGGSPDGDASVSTTVTDAELEPVNDWLRRVDHESNGREYVAQWLDRWLLGESAKFHSVEEERAAWSSVFYW